MPTSFASIWQVLFRLIVFEIRSSTINRFGAISGSTHWSREENRAQGYAAQSPKIYSSGDQRKPLVRFIATNPALSSQASVPSARSEENTSEIQDLMRNSHAVFC